jgi:hypothetical protein
LFVFTLASALVLVSGLPTGAVPQVAAFGALIGIAVLLSAGRWVRRKLADRAFGRCKAVGDKRRLAILRDFPEFSGLRLEAGREYDELAVSGRVLRIGSQLQNDAIDSLGDGLFYKLAHEARHLEVGASGDVQIFRTIKDVYIVVSLGVYLSFFLTLSGIYDDSSRVAILLYFVAFPYVWGALLVILDEALAAFEWRLELDADAAASVRCKAAGRPTGLPKTSDLRSPLRGVSSGHPPLILRWVAARSGVSSHVLIPVILAIGLIIAIEPLGMLTVFAMAESDHPDRVNGLIGIGNLVSLLGVTAALVAIARLQPRPGGVAASTVAPAQPAFIDDASLMVVRIYAIAAGLLGIVMAIFGAGLGLWIVADFANGGGLSIIELAPLVILALITVTYYNNALDHPSIPWLAAGAVAEWVRVAGFGWVIMATGVLPFYDDIGALGKAMTDNPTLLYPAMVDILTEEPGRLITLAIIAGLFALVVMGFARHGWRVDRRCVAGQRSSLAQKS